MANANFDLKYSTGSLQSLDLERLHCCLYKLTRGLVGSGDCVLAEAACQPNREDAVRAQEIVAHEVLIDSFASGMKLNRAGNRLYVPTRADQGGLYYVDVDPEGRFYCGEDRHCWSGHRIPIRWLESMPLPPGVDVGDPVLEPVAVAVGQASLAGELRDMVLVAHRFGLVSLLLEEPCTGPTCPLGVPAQSHLFDTGTLLSGIEYQPSSGLALLTRQGGVLGRVGVSSLGGQASPDRTGVLYHAGNVIVSGVAGGESRALAANPNNPDEMFIISRAPDALLVVDIGVTAAADGLVKAKQVIEVGDGPSRLLVGRVAQDPRLFAFVSCFDARVLYIIDLELHRVVSVVQGFNGPFEMALDPSPLRPYLYVADFRSSAIRVVNLAPLVAHGPRGQGGEIRIVASIGSGPKDTDAGG
ncbi:MAG: hypothetical protein MJD61_10985 [Proteobacteria bacterium]|nr:hypothetical protein [Pseudomonadota bacterium]